LFKKLPFIEKKGISPQYYSGEHIFAMPFIEKMPYGILSVFDRRLLRVPYLKNLLKARYDDGVFREL
jgi:hypothetical protein